MDLDRKNYPQSASAVLFDNPALSDVRLYIAVRRAEHGAMEVASAERDGGEERAAKKARPMPEGGEQQDEAAKPLPSGCRLYAHAAIFHQASQVWAGELLNWSNNKPADEEGRKVLVLPVDEAELPTAKAFVKFAYTGQLEAGMSVPDLLRMYQLADSMLAAPCARACRRQLVLIMENEGTASITHVTHLLSMPMYLRDAKAFKPLREACRWYLTRQLEHAKGLEEEDEKLSEEHILSLITPCLELLYGDVLATLTTPSLLTQFKALLALLRSDNLRVTTEDDVLALVNRCQPAVKDLPNAFKDLASSIRLHHISRYILMEVLPEVSWMNEMRSEIRTVIWNRLCPDRGQQVEDLPEAWQPSVRPRSGGEPADASRAQASLSESGFTADWSMPVSDFKAAVKEALALRYEDKSVVDRTSNTLARYQGLTWSMSLEFKCEGTELNVGLFLHHQFVHIPPPQPRAQLELHGKLAFVADERVREEGMFVKSHCPPNSGKGLSSFVQLPVEGWEAELDKHLGTASSQAAVIFRVSDAHIEF